MTKPKLKLGFTDYYETMDEFFMDTLSKTFDIERDDTFPDYLIFADETFGTNNLDYNPNHVRKIFFTGENRRPWNYQCHHAISFDHLDGPQFYRLPLYVLDNWVQSRSKGVPNVTGGSKALTFYDDRQEFCSFVASNPAGEYRNKIFHMLNEYKPVLSGGQLFNNIGGVLPRDVKSKIDFFSKCHFSLCFENSSWPGYLTEKLQHGLIANTVPLYWGSPTAEMDFNPGTYISRHDFSSDNAFIDRVIEIDKDSSTWEMYANAWPIVGRNWKNWDMIKFNNWFLENVYVGELS